VNAPSSRIALVTGAARGIGASIALRLANDGHDIAVLDLEEASCAETVTAIIKTGRRAIAIGANVVDEAAVKAAVARVLEALGPPTILVNNAGIIRDRSLAKMTLDDWDSVISVNLRGAFRMSREAQPHMRAAGWGRIVNLSSTAALGNVGEANYSAAKAGVQGFTKSLALELGRYGITANAVAPGFVETEMTRVIAERIGLPFDEMKKQQIDATAVGRIGQTEDIAHAVSFFADERSGFVTGQILYVAGGPRG
jgi:3-oxoacyl-[acyl-carrier protein] reductase